MSVKETQKGLHLTPQLLNASRWYNSAVNSAASSAWSETAPVSVEALKQALAQLASGISVVTSLAGAAPLGITASSLISLSLDPPLVLVAVDRKLDLHPAILGKGVYAVSILSASQVDLGRVFAGMIPEIQDRFASLETFTAVTSCPILADCLAWVDCRVWAVYPGGDHSIFVGEVLAAGVLQPGAPLVYHNRQWLTSREL
jgi:flavin reductase (DIM6/NTAB) family NADH-FMN oxidoreductase RutF